MSFHRNLTDRLKSQGHPICLGVDPDLPPHLTFLHNELARLDVEEYLYRFTNAIILAAESKCSVLKFQSAYFEAFGPKGLSALKKGIELAKSKKMLCILDAKRGDISSTMHAYGRAAFELYQADALTVTPYLGWDVLSPLIPWLQKDKGVYLVWLTSNPSATDVQDLLVTHQGTTGEYLLHLAELFLKNAAAHSVGSSIGLVAGATKIADHQTLLNRIGAGRKYLIPGVGAQGGAFDSCLAKTISDNPESLIPISRGIVDLKWKPEISPPTWSLFSECIRGNLNTYIDHWRRLTGSEDRVKNATKP